MAECVGWTGLRDECSTLARPGLGMKDNDRFADGEQSTESQWERELPMP